MIEVRIYRTREGREPYIEWYEKLRDNVSKLRIRKRIEQMVLGNFGDHKLLGGGIYELRFFFGAGYRIYFARDGQTIILLLCGGDKSSQRKDIEKARTYWQEYKERKYETLH